MRIAILGAGFTGLSAAYHLSKKGHNVFVFEKEKILGGLAQGYERKEWDWPLDKYYHHLFTNDKSALLLAKVVGQDILTLTPKTSTLINNAITQLDSPMSLIKFSLLSITERLRMGAALALFRFSPTYKFFEKYTANNFLPKLMGDKGFKMIWSPLFIAKFGKHAKDVSLAWFWARIKKRTTSLAYPKGGFQSFANKIMLAAKNNNAKIFLDSEIIEIGSNYIKFKKNGVLKKELFDKIIVTIPSSVFLKISKSIPNEYFEKLKNLQSLATTNLLLRLKKPFLKDNTYWLNICDPNSKLMAVVEHTNFIDKQKYNNETLVYIGHYVPHGHQYLGMTKEELLKKFTPYLLRLNKDFEKNLIGIELSKNLFAQPVATINYKDKIPSFKTGISGVYLANMDQIYPWDRGVNYAIELGIKIAKICCE